MPEVGLVLLAAGESQRMGSPKQLLDVGGVPMLRRSVLSALASRCRPVVVVCGASANAIGRTVADLPVELVRNTAWARGIGTSIHTGIEAMARHAVAATVLALADQPLLTARVFNRLVDTWRAGKLPIAASEYDDTLGVPALFDRSFFDRLLTLPADQGCKGLLMRQPADLLARCPCPEAGTDIDTPAEYQRLRRSL